VRLKALLIMPFLTAVAMAFWTGFERKAGVWTYDDKRTVTDIVGVAPWTPWPPRKDFDCAVIISNKLFDDNYPYLDVDCTASSFASICQWPERA
jgi:hypothetical protein